MDPVAQENIPGSTRQQRGSPLSFLILLAVLVWLLSSQSGDEILARAQYQDALQTLEFQLGNLTAWIKGNASDFTIPERSNAMTRLFESFVVRGVKQDPEFSSYWSNITGFIRGDAVAHNMTSNSSLHSSELPWREFSEELMRKENLTRVRERSRGFDWRSATQFAINVDEEAAVTESVNNVSEKFAVVHGRMEFTSNKTGQEHHVDFKGIHVLGNGSIYGFAAPIDSSIDIRMVASLVSDSYRNATARVAQPELKRLINNVKDMIKAGNVIGDQIAPTLSKSPCTFQFIAQIEPSYIPSKFMQEMEEELELRTGVWTVPRPPFHVSGVMVSPECGIILELQNSTGLRSSTFFGKMTTYAACSFLVYAVLIILFSRQTAAMRTPAALGRVSRWSFLIQSVVDAISFSGHITFAIMISGKPSMTLMAPAFLSVVLCLQEGQFALLVMQVQAHEDVTASVAAEPPAALIPPRAAEDPNERRSGLPLIIRRISYATPTNTGNSSIANALNAFLASVPAPIRLLVDHIRTDPQARLWFTMFVVLSLTVQIMVSPFLALLVVALAYLSIWTPLLLRAARRGRSSGLSTEYLIGTTLCRLFFALYFVGCPDNVLDIEPRGWIYLVGFAMLLQVIVLSMQEQFGASFLVPKQFLAAKSYDYHPPLPMPDAEAPQKSYGDCAICMDSIAVPVDLSRRKQVQFDTTAGIMNAVQMGVNASGLGGRKSYSLAPCHHLFHTECLEKWLAIKNICPHCRRPLPPL